MKIKELQDSIKELLDDNKKGIQIYALLKKEENFSIKFMNIEDAENKELS